MERSKKVIVVSVCSFIMTVVFCFVGFPGILEFVVRDQTALRKRNRMRGFYLKLPVPLDFRVYFFNITNPSEVQKGQTPILKEIGPYCYDAFKEKIEILENAGEDSLSYTPYEPYFFSQERSGSLTQDDYVTIIHPLIVGMANRVSRDSPALLPVVDKAIRSIFRNPQDIYLTTKVRDILFDGITINCSVTDFAGKAVCSQIKSQVPDLDEVERNVYKFSIFGPRNGTLPNRYKVLRGIKKSQELGRLVELNHQKEAKVWPVKKCNRFRGTDGWIFPPFVNKDQGFWIYVSDLCRNMHVVYEEDANYNGIFVEKYFADLGDMSKNPAEKCYCPTPKTCLPKGVMDLSKCMGVPIYATLPHFLRVDENVQKTVIGLNPETDNHIVKVLMQPMLGVPLEAYRRMQLNLPIQPNKKIALMQNLPNALHPIFWLEDGIAIEGDLLDMINLIFMALRIFDVVKYVLLGISLAGVCLGGYLWYKDKESRKITPLQTSSSISLPSKNSTAILKSKASTANITEESCLNHKTKNFEYQEKDYPEIL